MLDSTLTTTNISLVDSSSTAVTSAISIDSDSLVVTFTPASSLSYLETYTVSLSTSITDAAGNALAAYTWDFTTGSGTGSWNTSTNQVSSDSYIYQPYDANVVVDKRGNAIAVWMQSDGDTDSIFANYYTASTVSWGTATEIDAETDDTTNYYAASEPQIAIDGEGNAMVVWTQYNGTYKSIYYNLLTYSSTPSWGGATLIETTDFTAGSPQVAMDGDGTGNAVVLWRQKDSAVSNIYSLYSNYYTKSAGTWGGAELRESSTTYTVAAPSVAMNNDGAAVAVWAQSDGNAISLYGIDYVAGWDAAGAGVLLESTDLDVSINKTQVVINDAGNAIAVWQQIDSNNKTSIYANQYSANAWAGSASRQSVESTSTSVSTSDFSVTLDNSNNGTVLFIRDDGTTESVYANTYSSSAWGSESTIDSSAYDASSPSVVYDLTSGDAIAVWSQSDGTASSIYSSTYSGTWSTAAAIETSTYSSTNPFVASDRTATKESVMAVWHRTVGRVYSNLY